MAQDPRDLLGVKAFYMHHLGSDLYRQMDTYFRRVGSGYDRLGISNAAEDQIESLRLAQNFWVARDMVALLEAAQESMPDDGVLLGEPPSPHGFLILSTPISVPVRSRHGAEVMEINALHWRPSHRRLPASNFAPAQEDEGIVLQWFRDTPDPKEAAVYQGYAPLAGLTFLPANLVLQQSADLAMGAIDRMSVALSRRARAMWVLMQQQLASTVIVDGHRKQQEKAQRTRTSPSVSIVALRRKSVDRPGSGGVHVEYSHRWVVRGHWRNQWHPGLQAHRPHWIADHVKGPVDAPLVVKDKINLWKR